MSHFGRLVVFRAAQSKGNKPEWHLAWAPMGGGLWRMLEGYKEVATNEKGAFQSLVLSVGVLCEPKALVSQEEARIANEIKPISQTTLASSWVTRWKFASNLQLSPSPFISPLSPDNMLLFGNECPSAADLRSHASLGGSARQEAAAQTTKNTASRREALLNKVIFRAADHFIILGILSTSPPVFHETPKECEGRALLTIQVGHASKQETA
ncbi:hypothetical protein EK21DRAFT_115091 [Setomelanomma holmii]|uniref:Uncharacterized protein n=1 Tax=Setomelanomma holmii TaxID=210430 RepID=A0A9P4LK21_9PLEO|nr:hypothetical protein EK21DRAFT_115091 [Setomelanomma holmii]